VVLLVQWVNPVNLVGQVTLVLPVLPDNLVVPPSKPANKQLPLHADHVPAVLPVHPVNKVHPVMLVLLALPDKVVETPFPVHPVQKAHLAHLVHPETTVNPVNLVNPAAAKMPDPLHKDLPAMLAHLAHLAHPVNPANLAALASPAAKVLPVNPVFLATMDIPAHKDLREIPAVPANVVSAPNTALWTVVSSSRTELGVVRKPTRTSVKDLFCVLLLLPTQQIHQFFSLYTAVLFPVASVRLV